MTLLDVMERHGYTLERLAGAIGVAPEALNRKIKGNSFTIGDTQRIIQALKLTTEEVMEVFFPTGRDTSVFVVQRCLVTFDLPVKQFAGVYASLNGAVDALERDAAAAESERDFLRTQVENLIMLQGMAAQKALPNPARRSWWARLFGGSA